MSNEQTPSAISAARLIVEIEQVAMRREDLRAYFDATRDNVQRLTLREKLHEARREHTKLVAELAGLPAREV